MPPADTDIANDKPNWTPIGDAAQLTGKSDRTLRRWVASGKLAHKRESGRLFVDLSSPALTEGDSDIAPPIDTDLDTAQKEIDRLATELASVKAVLSEVIGERDYLRQMLAMSLSSQPKRIEAPARPRWWWPWAKGE